jgi:hypothetical protein
MSMSMSISMSMSVHGAVVCNPCGGRGAGKELSALIGAGRFTRSTALILDDQCDGPDSTRKAKQLRDPRYDGKAISNGTWATAVTNPCFPRLPACRADLHARAPAFEHRD